jgi:outer membrane protein OmpA-like peptidoglycan-associated protein
MRALGLIVALCLTSAAPAFAQNAADMDRAEQELRSNMAPAGVAVERTSPTEIRLRMPSDITFDYDRAYVRHDFMARLHDLSRALQSHPGMSIEIVGHADARGSDDYNLDLSERRALSVGAVLRDDGVPRRSIETRGLGESDPIATNATDAGRARNRRVEIRLNASPVYREPNDDKK